MKRLLFLIFLLSGLLGCTSVDTFNLGNVDLTRFRHIHVISAGNDSVHLDQMIANELTRHGFQATAGVRTMRPEEAELLVDYTAGWNWEIRKYLMQLEVNVRDAKTGHLLATSRVFHPGVTNKAPEKIVATVVAQMLTPAKRSP